MALPPILTTIPALASLGKIIQRLAGLLCIVAACAHARADELGSPVLSQFSSADIGYDFEVQRATRASDGTMYFGGAALYSFDGDRWKSWPCSTLEYISALTATADGKIWVGGLSDFGWYERDAGTNWQFHSLASKLKPEDGATGTIQFVYSARGVIVFLTAEKVLLWDGAQLKVVNLPGTRRLRGFVTPEGVYVHHAKDGLYQVSGSELHLVLPQARIGNPDIGVIWGTRLDESRMLLATGDGLRIWHTNGSVQTYAPEVSAILSKDRGNVTYGAKLPNGRYAFSTFKAGIVVMRPDGALERIIGESEGLPTSCIISVESGTGNELWCTSPFHVVRLDVGSTTTIFDARNGLPPQPYTSINRVGGRVLVTNSSGMFVLDPSTRMFTRSPIHNELAHDVTTTARGAIISGYRGAWTLADGAKVPLHISQQDVFTALESRRTPGTIVLAETSQLVAIAKDGRERVIADSFPKPAMSLAEDEEGRIWGGTFEGVMLIIPSSTGVVHPSRIPATLGLPATRGNTFVRNIGEHGLLFTADNGAWFLPKGATRVAAVIDYPASRTLANTSECLDGASVWVLHAGTPQAAPLAARIAITHGIAKWEAHEITGLSAIGQPVRIMPEADAEGRQILWVGGAKGVLRHVLSPTEPPPPRSPMLRSYARQGRSVEPIRGILPYSTSAVVFEFAEPEFSRRAALRLQTRIDGVDADWVPAPADSRRELTAVREGRYMFQVRAVSETGVASEPTVFSFEVAPPWWRTRPALVGAGAALMMLLYGGYRFRVRALQRRNTVLEQKVQERTEELAEASAAKTMFVANMSHDIRNPLNGIVGLTLALEDSRLDPRQRDIVATLRECTTYLSSLVDDVLDFASIEAGRLELRLGPFTPAELLNSVVTTLKGQAAERGASIVIETDPDLPPTLRGDAGRIQQILVNYLGNALKYAGGHIRIVATLAPNTPDEVEFYVADEGAGISPEDQATLFNKFARLEGSRREQIKGTGLGLASCRLLADLMGGAVGVESKLGQGSRFYLRLPLVVATEPVPVNSDATLPPTSVLLVEDTDYNAMAATAVLGRLGLTCDRAKNGEEAIRLFSAKRHNIVLLDRNLPDMDGTEVAQKLREIETDGMRSVLLAVTAYCTAEDRALCLKSGMDAFVGKPLTPEKLRRVLVDAGRKMLGAGAIDAPVAAAEAGELNTTLLEYLAEGTHGGLAAQTERYLTALAEAYDELRSVSSQGVGHVVGDAAHRVLGQARMIGATRLCAAAVQLETAARKEDRDGVALALPLVENEVQALTAALRRRLEAPKA